MRVKAILFLAMTLGSISPALSQETNSLVLTQTIALPNVQGGFNHMSVDAEHRRLFAAAPTNKTVEVLDLTSGKPWRSLEGEKPIAARYAPEFNQLYVPRGQSIYFYDGTTLDPTTRVDLHSILDELHYDARAKQLYVGCMSSGKTGIAAIAIPEGKLLGKIPLPDRPQGIAIERGGKRIFANVASRDEVAVMDRERRVLLALWPLKGVHDNTPMALDDVHHRLFVGARQPARLVAFDTVTGKQVAEVAIDGDADDMSWDPARLRVYISCGNGFIDVVEEGDADRYRRLARIPTADGAATSTFSAPLNSFYLGVPRRGSKPAEIRVFAVGN